MPRARLRPIKYKLILSVTAIIAVMSVVFYYYSYNHTLKNDKEIEKRQVNLLKQKLLNIAEIYLETKDRLEFENGLERILQHNNVAYLVVADSTGKIRNRINYALALKKGYSQINKYSDYINEEDTLTNVVTPVLQSKQYLGSISFGFSKREFIESERSARKEYGYISIIVLGGAFLFVFLISVLITRPFGPILNGAKKIAEGDYTQRIKTKRKDEFSFIASSFNSIAEKLEESNSQVIHLNNKLKTAFRDKLGELNLEINQRRIAEASLKKSEEQFRLLFNIAPIGMVITTPGRDIQKVNKAFENTLGYNTGELLDMTTESLTYYEDREKDKKIYRDFLNGKMDNKTFEKRFVTKGGSIIEVIVRTTLYKDEKEEPALFIEQVIDITEQNKMQRDLLIAKEKAEESDMMKSAFLAQMSHEIRTPLNVILAASSIFEEEVKEYLDTDSRLVVDSVKSAGKRLMRTIDLILNMSAVQTGKYEPQFETLMLNDELRNLVEEFKPLCLEKNIGLEFQTHLEDVQLKADKYTFEQIFQNLISNAIKYTRQGRVDVVVFKTDKVFVEIKDTGIGMSKEYLERLFNPFSQEVVGQKREFEGNGLGLALVKKYVEINNALIKVESEKDKGSTFTVIFNN